MTEQQENATITATTQSNSDPEGGALPSTATTPHVTLSTTSMDIAADSQATETHPFPTSTAISPPTSSPVSTAISPPISPHSIPISHSQPQHHAPSQSTTTTAEDNSNTIVDASEPQVGADTTDGDKDAVIRDQVQDQQKLQQQEEEERRLAEKKEQKMALRTKILSSMDKIVEQFRDVKEAYFQQRQRDSETDQNGSESISNDSVSSSKENRNGLFYDERQETVNDIREANYQYLDARARLKRATRDHLHIRRLELLEDFDDMGDEEGGLRRSDRAVKRRRGVAMPPKLIGLSETEIDCDLVALKHLSFHRSLVMPRSYSGIFDDFNGRRSPELSPKRQQRRKRGVNRKRENKV